MQFHWITSLLYPLLLCICKIQYYIRSKILIVEIGELLRTKLFLVFIQNSSLEMSCNLFKDTDHVLGNLTNNARNVKNVKLPIQWRIRQICPLRTSPSYKNLSNGSFELHLNIIHHLKSFLLTLTNLKLLFLISAISITFL